MSSGRWGWWLGSSRLSFRWVGSAANHFHIDRWFATHRDHLLEGPHVFDKPLCKQQKMRTNEFLKRHAVASNPKTVTAWDPPGRPQDSCITRRVLPCNCRGVALTDKDIKRTNMSNWMGDGQKQHKYTHHNYAKQYAEGWCNK